MRSRRQLGQPQPKPPRDVNVFLGPAQDDSWFARSCTDGRRAAPLRVRRLRFSLSLEEGGVGELQSQGKKTYEEEEDEEVAVQVRRRVRRGILNTISRNRREDEMMPAAAWSKPLFTGQGLRKHLVELEALFMLGASRLGRVPQPGEVEFVVLDSTKKMLALQSMSEPIRDRLLRAEQNATSDLRMEVQVGDADPVANPVEMVGWAAATWPQCVIGLGRFYPDEIVPATVVAEASCLQQKWWAPYKEGVTSFYNEDDIEESLI